MCGILGTFDLSRELDPGSLRHRGPDTQKVHADDRFRFGHTLLSIIGDGIGVGTSVSEEFFSILSALNINYEAVISDDLFVKALCSAARVKVAQEEVHNKLIQ